MRRTNLLASPSAQRRLPHLLERYVEECRPPTETEAKKSTGRLPTLAGFCRFLGIGQNALERLATENPDVLDRIRTVLEDELLNHSPSPTLLNSYMKRRLGYDGECERETAEAACGQLHLVFEHNIEEDGA